MDSSESRWRAKSCSWPHDILSPEQEGVLTAAMKQHAPFITRIAGLIAGDDVHLCLELEQQAYLLLWKLGTVRIAAHEPKQVRALLRRRMNREHARSLGRALV